PSRARAPFRPGLGPAPPRRHRQDLLEPPPALGQVSPLLPEPPQRSRSLLGPVRLASLDGPPEGRAHVRVLLVAPVQPLALVVTGEVGFRLHRQAEEVFGVAPPNQFE